MKKLLSKAKSSFQDSSISQTPQPPRNPATSQAPPSSTTNTNTIQPPTPIDLLRYRYHHGANLGSIFVLEQWLHPSMFPPSSSSSSSSPSELSAVTSSLQTTGSAAATRARWEAHWAGAVTDADFAWLAGPPARCTSLRVPVGYFTLGEAFCAGTPFEGAGVSRVYVGAWRAVRELVARARRCGVGVLLDFHAVPGGANAEAHSGTGSGRAELWGSRRNREAAKRALVFMAREVKAGMDGVVGLQIVNEAVWDAEGMYAWYEDVIGEISKVDDSIPIYISDGWDLNRALVWTGKRHALRGGPRNPVVVDTHRYYTFSDSDRSQSPQQIIGRIGSELWELDGKEGSLADRGEAELIVGEWSCVLDGQTWGRVRPDERDGLVKQFGQVQSRKWQQRAGGSYFWTYKMDWMDGGEWGFVEQTKKGNISPPPFLTLTPQEVKSKTQNAQARREELAASARRSHEDYWNNASPGKKFEHHLYGEGWDLGFSDALKFFNMRVDGALGDGVAREGGDKIGCLEIWVKKRLLESGQRGEFVWEWEQGFRSGVAAFYHCVGI